MTAPIWNRRAASGGSPGRVRPAPTLLALAVLWALALVGQTWVFALLFLGWAVSDVLAGESWMLQRVTRRHNPATFWAIVVTWVAMAILWLIYG